MKVTEKKIIVFELEYEDFAHMVNLIAEMKSDKNLKRRSKSFQKSLEIISKGFSQFKVD